MWLLQIITARCDVISRADQDTFALRSQHCSPATQRGGFFREKIIAVAAPGQYDGTADVINVSCSVLHELDLRFHTFKMAKATALLWAEIETRHDCRLADQVKEIRPVGTIGQAPNTL